MVTCCSVSGGSVGGESRGVSVWITVTASLELCSSSDGRGKGNSSFWSSTETEASGGSGVGSSSCDSGASSGGSVWEGGGWMAVSGRGVLRFSSAIFVFLESVCLV